MATDVPVPPPIPGTEGSQGATQASIPDRQLYLQAKENEAWAWLRGKSPAERIKSLNYLRSKGYYSDSPVSNDGLGDADVARVRNFLVYADVSGMSIKDGMDSLSKFRNVPISTGPQPTPTADVDTVFKSVMQQQLGRLPKAAELEKFRNAYRQMEWGGNAPSVSSAAQQQVTAQNPAEEQATRFANFASTFEQMLRGA